MPKSIHCRQTNASSSGCYFCTLATEIPLHTTVLPAFPVSFPGASSLRDRDLCWAQRVHHTALPLDIPPQRLPHKQQQFKTHSTFVPNPKRLPSSRRIETTAATAGQLSSAEFSLWPRWFRYGPRGYRQWFPGPRPRRRATGYIERDLVSRVTKTQVYCRFMGIALLLNGAGAIAEAAPSARRRRCAKRNSRVRTLHSYFIHRRGRYQRDRCDRR